MLLKFINQRSMEITLSQDDTVLDLKQAFVEAFSGLKLELFKKAHGDSQSSSARMRVKGVEPLADLVTCNLPCTVKLDEAIKVSEVESAFEEQTGLHVQVFRKMRGVWIETVQTDHYTLTEQMTLSANS